MTQFYALKRKERAKLVHEQLAQAQDIPSFLRKHWQKETGFAFPSGHTMFAASWALLAAGLLWPRRRWGTIAVLLVWATAVMGSRPALGMHWPLDLIVATLISRLLVTVACWLTQRLCGPLSPPGEEAQDIKNGCLKRNNVDFSGIRPHILKSCHAFSFHRCGENDTL